MKDNKLPPTLQASTASSSICITKKQIGSTSSKKSNEKNDDAKVPIIRKTKVASASKSTTVKGQKRISSLLSRQEDSISKGESTLNEKKPASSLEKSSASRQMIKQSKDHPNASFKLSEMIDKSKGPVIQPDMEVLALKPEPDFTPVKGSTKKTIDRNKEKREN